MNPRYFFSPAPDSLCNSGITVSFSSFPPPAPGDGRIPVLNSRNRSSSSSSSSRVLISSSFLARTAMRMSRARWFSFLRRVFHYQNGSTRSELGSNPFNSRSWMAMESIALVGQIIVTTYTLMVSKAERPVWPMRTWVSGYVLGCLLSLLVLFCRYRIFHAGQGDGFNHHDLEEQRNNEESRGVHLLNKCRTTLELFFAIWFVMGNVWVFDSRFGSFRRAPKLHVLCISILAWNAISYSFPFLLFVLLCCCVPLVGTLVGYNMNVGSADRGASDDQISKLPSCRFKDFDTNLEIGKSTNHNQNPECCICLSKYRDKEEIRQLPCSHIFHLNCVDQWLRIISCCPLCKQELER
ncbi:hypothetical protein U1Q18_000260 [Sarracenia purpurea var. burkii]